MHKMNYLTSGLDLVFLLHSQTKSWENISNMQCFYSISETKLWRVGNSDTNQNGRLNEYVNESVKVESTEENVPLK